MSAVEWFAAKLRYETDPSDVHADPGAQTVVDSRGAAAWAQGRVPGAVHLPGGLDAVGRLDPHRPVVVYCWGPGCNGATKAALALARQGFAVREMVGGFEYWAREGLPVQTDGGVAARPADPLTAPVAAAVCDC